MLLVLITQKLTIREYVKDVQRFSGVLLSNWLCELDALLLR